MTHAQWVWMSEALMAEEERQTEKMEMMFKTSVKALVEVLVQTLGLRIKKPSTKISEIRDDAARKIDDTVGLKIEPFTPLAFLCGNPDLLKNAIDNAGLEAKSEHATVSMSDASAKTPFDKMSEALASGDLGDMMPYFAEFETKMQTEEFEKQAAAAELKAQQKILGVEMRPADAPEAPHIGSKPKQPVQIQVWDPKK